MTAQEYQAEATRLRAESTVYRQQGMRDLADLTARQAEECERLADPVVTVPADHEAPAPVLREETQNI